MFEPLLLLWMMSQGLGQSKGGATTAPGKAPKPPSWPTTRSPPPPMPAFVPNPPAPPAPSEPTANTATPLAKLHSSPPKAPKPKAEPSPVDVVKQAATRRAAAAANKAKAAAASKAKSVANKASSSLFHAFGFGGGSTPMTVKSVGDLQRVLNTWGATLALDGKWGPKTQAAWQSMAKRNNLPTAITRNGPTTAKVANQTWDALNVPNIP